MNDYFLITLNTPFAYPTGPPRTTGLNPPRIAPRSGNLYSETKNKNTSSYFMLFSNLSENFHYLSGASRPILDAIAADPPRTTTRPGKF